MTSSTYSKGGTKLLKGGTKLLKGGTKLLKGGTKLLKGGTKLLKGGTKLLKGGTKSLGWATGGVVRPPRPPPPPLATGLQEHVTRTSDNYESVQENYLNYLRQNTCQGNWSIIILAIYFPGFPLYDRDQYHRDHGVWKEALPKRLDNIARSGTVRLLQCFKCSVHIPSIPHDLSESNFLIAPSI